jgi:hypothetical protein
MTHTTIDLELEVSASAWHGKAAPKRLPPPVERAESSPSLWGFDEYRERERFGQIERRLLQLEIELFADFGVQFAVGARECVRRLFVACPSIRVPSISAQPDGNLVCTWMNAQRERLTVRCTGLGLQYAIVSVPPGALVPALRIWGNQASPSSFWDEIPAARRIAE